MKTIILSAPDTNKLESISAAKVYVVTRTATDPAEKASNLIEYWQKGAAGWKANFSIDCLFPSPEQAHSIIEELPPGGDPRFDYEVVPIRLVPQLEV